MAREYDKLVRDRIPELVREDGETPVTHAAGDEEYERRLADKLEEEIAEFREDRTLRELADVLEVVHAVREHRGVAAAELERLRAEKRAKRGGFDDRIVLERVEE